MTQAAEADPGAVSSSSRARPTIRRIVLGIRHAINATRPRLPRGAALLPRLTDVDPAVWRASGRARGVTAVEVCCVVGTVSYPYGSRRRDFMPVPGREPADWQSRWDRLTAAVPERTPLPPVDLVQTVDGYWIADGHNRLALAKAMGQLWIDADVVEIGDLGRARGPARACDCCLSDAPDRQSAERVHREAHDLVATILLKVQQVRSARVAPVHSVPVIQRHPHTADDPQS